MPQEVKWLLELDKLYNLDCMKGMKEFPDKYFALAIVDVPYGINATKAVRRFKYRWHGMLQENMKDKEKRIHPTQKPVALYAWLLDKYAKYGDVILDTHVGSASSLVACYRCGFHFVGFEIDPEYYKAADERLSAEMAQLRLDSMIGGDNTCL